MRDLYVWGPSMKRQTREPLNLDFVAYILLERLVEATISYHHERQFDFQ